jgi:multidrug efflux pump subunit AcrB
MTVLKASSVSTLDIIAGVKNLLPVIAKSLPEGLEIKLVGDQSDFVKSSVGVVIEEGLLAAALTGFMILLFLGSWRSALIITVSIPLAILASLTALSALGQTLNIMTLGGLALAVGILVDDATVTLENSNFHLEEDKPAEPAILDGSRQIVVLATVSLLCICVAFVPMFGLGGVSGYLFRPLAEAVVFAMIASYVLSRALVPVMAKYLLRPHQNGTDGRDPAGTPAIAKGNVLSRFQRGFEHHFERVRNL